jgi:hypothetical protein
MAKEGILPPLDDMFGPGGQQLLDQMPFEGAYALRVDSLRKLLNIYAGELTVVEAELAARLDGHAGYAAIQAICGVGPIMAAIFVAEIGDVSRFGSARHLCSWAGLTPSHRESDTKVQRGHITKQGNHLVRWAAIEAVARYKGGEPIAPTYTRVARRRGRMIGRVAAARKLLTACATERSAAWPQTRREGSDTATVRTRRTTCAPRSSSERGRCNCLSPPGCGRRHTMRPKGRPRALVQARSRPEAERRNVCASEPTMPRSVLLSPGEARCVQPPTGRDHEPLAGLQPHGGWRQLNHRSRQGFPSGRA